MNEQIKELAEQCGFRSNPDIYDRNQSFDIPMFAELIVKECIWIVYHSHCLNKESKITEHLDKVKEHFGVK